MSHLAEPFDEQRDWRRIDRPQLQEELGYCAYCGRIAPRQTFKVVEEGVLECRECVEREKANIALNDVK